METPPKQTRTANTTLSSSPPDINSLAIGPTPVSTEDSDARLRDLAIQRLTENNRRQKWDTHLRILLAVALITIFCFVNVGVGWLVHDAYSAELELLKLQQIKATDRTITPGVFMSLIGASVVQVGAGIATMLAYLFPKNPPA